MQVPALGEPCSAPRNAGCTRPAPLPHCGLCVCASHCSPVSIAPKSAFSSIRCGMESGSFLPSLVGWKPSLGWENHEAHKRPPRPPSLTPTHPQRAPIRSGTGLVEEPQLCPQRHQGLLECHLPPPQRGSRGTAAPPPPFGSAMGSRCPSAAFSPPIRRGTREKPQQWKVGLTNTNKTSSGC